MTNTTQVIYQNQCIYKILVSAEVLNICTYLLKHNCTIMIKLVLALSHPHILSWSQL